MDLARAASSFSPEQLQFIGAMAVFGAIPFLGFMWNVATWKARVDYDLNNLGKELKTKKGLAIAKRIEEKQCTEGEKMSALKIWLFVKGYLPWKKIGAFILGSLGLAVAGIIGVSNTELKDEYCKSAPVEMPKVEAPAVPVAPEKK